MAHTRALYGQKAGGPAVIRNRAAQFLPIQRSALPVSGRIYQNSAILTAITAALLLVSALPSEACVVVGSAPPATHPGNGPLITAASGNRNRTSGALNNVGSNGNYWSFAPNSKTNARNLNFNSSAVNPLNTNNRANGFAVRPSRALGRRPGTCRLAMKYTFADIHRFTTAAYLKAREEERDIPAQLAFEIDMERHLKDLALELYRRTWKPQPLDWFVTLEPTVREVFAPKFRDRVVSHVLFDQIAPIFERYFVYDSFSCRVGKGTLFGIERLEHHLRSVTDNYTREAWILSYDIRGYFMSINRVRLQEITLQTLGKHQARHPDAIDYGFSEYLVAAFLERDPLEGCVYHGDPGRIRLVQPGKSLRDQPPGTGVPIGDVINQLFSNIYLNPLDQFIKRNLKIRNSVRYVDDGKVLHWDRAYLEECRGRIGEFLDRELRLQLHPDKTVITSTEETTYFLGAAIKPFRRYARNDAVQRFRVYIRNLEGRLAAGVPVDLRYELATLNSRLGYLSHFDEYTAVRKAIAAAPRIRAAFSFNPSLSKAKLIKTV